MSYRSRRGPLSTLPRSLPVPRMKRFPSISLLALAYSPIRRPATNSRITKSRIIWSNERPLFSFKQQLCSRVLPVCQHRPVGYPLGISTSAINRTMPAVAVEVSYVRTSPQKLWTITPNPLYEQQTAYCSYRFPIPNNVSLVVVPTVPLCFHTGSLGTLA